MYKSKSTRSLFEPKDDGYDCVRFDILEEYPDVDIEYAVEVVRTVQFLLSTGKRNTTFSEIKREIGLNIRTIRSTVYALELLRYFTVNREKSRKPFICVDGKLFFGSRIAGGTKECLQKLTLGANEYPEIRDKVGTLPEVADTHFENDDLRSAIKVYNEAIKILINAEIKIFPLIKWKRAAFKIGLGLKFSNKSERRS
jgi:hypothetical protein